MTAGYVVDPHTGTALAAALRSLSLSSAKAELTVGEVGSDGDSISDTLLSPFPPLSRSVVCMGCAHPAKFPNTVATAAAAAGLAEATIPDSTHRNVASVLRITEQLQELKLQGKSVGADLKMKREHISMWSVELRRVIDELAANRGFGRCNICS